MHVGKPPRVRARLPLRQILSDFVPLRLSPSSSSPKRRTQSTMPPLSHSHAAALRMLGEKCLWDWFVARCFLSYRWEPPRALLGNFLIEVPALADGPEQAKTDEEAQRTAGEAEQGKVFHAE